MGEEESVSGKLRVPETKYVTFVNPELRKGVFVFARIAEVLARRRPDIPLLIVEGAARASFLAQLGVDLGSLQNIKTMPNSPDARQFLAVTKFLLMPSLMENAALVAMEAMLNGIPVVGSNRGGLPETIGDVGMTLDIPARYTPETRDLPTAEEVEPWVETIIRLWDDAAEYERCSHAARERGQQWHPDRLAPVYREFFGNLTHQPGPPLVPNHRAVVPATAAQSASCHVRTGDEVSLARKTAPAPPFVTCQWLGKAGRLGNQLFQIAATIGTARKNGLDFVFPPWNYAGYFQRAIPQSAEIPETEVYAEPSFAYKEIRICTPTDLAGCFQSERYFKNCEVEVRSYFTPRPELIDGLRKRFDVLLSKPTCSVHVRRGDYAQYPQYVDLAATDYYERAIERFAADTTFVFFSDDITWCQNRFRDGRFVFISGQSSIEDLFLMSLCNGHIIANSSFSWWGAWLNGRTQKMVIAPAGWFAGSYADRSLPFSSQPYQGYHDPSDIIPGDWIKL